MQVIILFCINQCINELIRQLADEDVELWKNAVFLPSKQKLYNKSLLDDGKKTAFYQVKDVSSWKELVG